MSGTQPARPSIAIVAVHGVADQRPHESAGFIANLLLRITRDDSEAAYTSFRELPLRIPTAPVSVDDGAGLAAPVSSKLKMEERPYYLANTTGAREKMAHRASPDPPSAAVDAGAREGANAEAVQPAATAEAARAGGKKKKKKKRDEPLPFAPDHEFMRSLLLKYRGSKEPYETIRLEGQKLRDGTPAADVHVYEMYWADLSRLGAGLFRIIGELYQLLVHVAGLGRVVVEHARLEHSGSRAWGIYRWTHNAAVRVLTLFVPVIGMLMLGTIGLVLPGRLPHGSKPGVSMGVLAVLAAGVAGWMLYRARSAPRKAKDATKPRPRHLPTAVWALVPFAAAGVGLLAGWVLHGRRVAGVKLGRGLMDVEHLLALEWLLLAGVALGWLFAVYRRRRPGALLWGLVFLIPSFLAMALMLLGGGFTASLIPGEAYTPRERVALVALWMFEKQFLVLVASWITLGGFALVAGVHGHVLQLLVRDEEDEKKRERARRAAWTARTTLAVSGASLFIMALLVFVALNAGIGRILQPLMATYRPMLGYSGLDLSERHRLDVVLESILMASATSGLPVLLACMGVTMVLTVWAILPPALTEVTAPRDASPGWLAPRGGDDDTEKRKARWEKVAEDGDRSERLGTWLTRGYPTLAAAATLLWVGLFILLPGVSLLRAVTTASTGEMPPLEWLANVSDTAVTRLGGLIAAASVGLLALRGRFNVVAGGLRPALDVMLDVDNYLREHPRDSTPRARIVERYVSLLRYLSLWRDAEGKPYGAVILVTHSQGTVITADLLGFLRREKPQGMDDLIPGLDNPDDEPQPGAIPLYLFTMGSPLRQLYGRAFPHLYAWVSGRPPGMGKALKQVPRVQEQLSSPPADLDADQGHEVDKGQELTGNEAPDPSQIGLVRWVNAYRSGDYVGRELWRVEDCGCLYRRIPTPVSLPAFDPPVLTVSQDEEGLRRELCIGGGAHTHYWDATAPAIGIEVDLLLEDAITRCTLPGTAAAVQLPEPENTGERS